MRCATTFELHVPDRTRLPPHLTFDNPPSKLDTKLFRPSHVLAIRSTDSTSTLLLPVHGLLWAASSPLLALISSVPHHQTVTPKLDYRRPPSLNSIPVLVLNLPSTRAIRALQKWIYLAAPQPLLASLLPTLLAPQISSAILSNAPNNIALSISRLHRRSILDRVSLVHGLWQNVVALEIGDPELWKVMKIAWGVLVEALVLQKERRLGETAATSSAVAVVAGVATVVI